MRPIFMPKRPSIAKQIIDELKLFDIDVVTNHVSPTATVSGGMRISNVSSLDLRIQAEELPTSSDLLLLWNTVASALVVAFPFSEFKHTATKPTFTTSEASISVMRELMITSKREQGSIVRMVCEITVSLPPKEEKSVEKESTEK